MSEFKFKCNPLNIRYNRRDNWYGQIKSDKGFCRFNSTYDGLSASILIINRYRSFGFVTINQIISRWAGPCETSVSYYVDYVVMFMNHNYKTLYGDNCVRTYLGTTEIASVKDCALLLSAMANFEQGRDCKLVFSAYVCCKSDFNEVKK